MPYARSYKRKYPSRRRYPRRKATNYISSAKNAYSVAMSAWKMAKYLKGLLNVEFKRYDVSSFSGFAQAPSTTTLASVGQGDAVNNRSGNSIRLKHLTVRGFVTKNVAASDTHCRILIVLCKDDTTPALSDILQSTAAGTAIASPYNPDMYGKIKVLYDQKMDVDTTNPSRNVNCSVALNLKQRYDGTAANDYQSNIHMFLLTNDANVPSLTGYSRVTYLDN